MTRNMAVKASLGGFVVLAMGLLGFGATSSSFAQSDVTLRVANYGGLFTASQRKYAGELFTKRTGVKVQYIDANPTDHLAKMIASKGREAPYDVVYLDDDIQPQAAGAGVLQKITPALIPNLNHLYDEAKNKDGYGPGLIFLSFGIIYNVEKFKAAGIPEPSTWESLWDPRLAGRVAIPGPSNVNGRVLLVVASRLNGGSEKAVEKGIEKIATLKVHSYWNSSAQIEGLLSSGDVWASPLISGRAWGLVDRGLPVRYVLPRDKAGLAGVGGWTTIDVVAGTKLSKEAHAYINTVLDPLPQLGQAHEIPYGPTNKLLGPVIAQYPDMAKKFPTTPEQLKQLYLPNWAEYYRNHQKAMDLWNRQVIRQ